MFIFKRLFYQNLNIGVKVALTLGLKYFFDVFNTNGRIGKRSPFPFFK